MAVDVLDLDWKPRRKLPSFCANAVDQHGVADSHGPGLSPAQHEVDAKQHPALKETKVK
jgi:hypothetical protein